VRVPATAAPIVGTEGGTITTMEHSTPTDAAPATVIPVGGTVPAAISRSPATPPMVHALMVPDAVPELVTVMKQVGLTIVAFVNATVPIVPGDVSLAEHTAVETDRFAELPSDPNNPKTNPAMATAATSVIAMRMTVARIGEMAFLLLYLISFTVRWCWGGAYNRYGGATPPPRTLFQSRASDELIEGNLRCVYQALKRQT